MTAELAVRLAGMIVLTLLGGRFGLEIAVPPVTTDVFALTFALLGALVGLILTPYVTTRPARRVRRIIQSMPVEALVTSFIGLVFGLIMGALFAVPLGLLPRPWGEWMPSLAAIISAYVSITIFGNRADDFIQLGNNLFRRRESAAPEIPETPRAAELQILMDSSAIIDGRILDISRTGFVPGTLVVPGFVLRELQHIADESNTQRRNRGRRGLEILEEMKRESKVPVVVLDADVENVREVDHKLVALARQLDAQLLTTDSVLNKTAKLQGVQVLNVNELANAVKAMFLPGEVISIQVIAEGREPGQGVGYLDDGTMVVVEDGRRYIDRTIDVVIIRMIQTAAGKMYFARPEDNPRK